METAGAYHIPVTGRELGAVTPLSCGETWGLSHTCDGERVGSCQAPVMRRQLGAVRYLRWGESWALSLTCDVERAGVCHTPVMGREIGDCHIPESLRQLAVVTYL